MSDDEIEYEYAVKPPQNDVLLVSGAPLEFCRCYAELWNEKHGADAWIVVRRPIVAPPPWEPIEGDKR